MKSDEFRVTGDAARIEAWSRIRPQFEPRDTMLDFRAQLRDAIGALRVDAGQVLQAEYRPPADPQGGFVDVENVTLYNVGMNFFAHLMHSGVRCVRLDGQGDSHMLRYFGGAPGTESAESVATFASDPPHFPKSPAGWWRLFRTASIQRAIDVPSVGAFSLSLDVWTPVPQNWLPSRLKGMLDGLVSAMHFHDGSSMEVLRPRLREHLGTDDWELLLDDSFAPLGERRLLRPHMQTFAWNPADELCHEFEVRVHAGTPRVEAKALA